MQSKSNKLKYNMKKYANNPKYSRIRKFERQKNKLQMKMHSQQ
jgi:hypothetical protein